MLFPSAFGVLLRSETGPGDTGQWEAWWTQRLVRRGVGRRHRGSRVGGDLRAKLLSRMGKVMGTERTGRRGFRRAARRQRYETRTARAAVEGRPTQLVEREGAAAVDFLIRGGILG